MNKISTKIDELESIIKKVEFAHKWGNISKIPFEDLIQHLNDYIDLLEGRHERTNL